MGNFYTNLIVQSGDADHVVDILKRARRRAFVSPARDGCVVVFDQECDKQDIAVITRLAARLSTACAAPVLAVLNHDDDILCYWLFDKGSQVDAYNSCPDYFGEGSGQERGGDAALLCATLGRPAAQLAVQDLLDSDDFVFAVERHLALAAALGLPACSVGCGYNYIEAGELPDDLSSDQLRKT